MCTERAFDMRKVIVIGCPGSGKSTFARALHDATQIPLYHLDMMYWNSAKTTVDKDIFLGRLSKVLLFFSIIQRNYVSTASEKDEEDSVATFRGSKPRRMQSLQSS